MSRADNDGTIGQSSNRSTVQVFLGMFDTKADAALAFDLYYVLVDGKDAHPNFSFSIYAQELQHRHKVLHPLEPFMIVLDSLQPVQSTTPYVEHLGTKCSGTTSEHYINGFYKAHLMRK